MTTARWRCALSELVGSFSLIFIGAGAICTDRLTGGGLGLIGIALAHGLVLAILVSATMHISGAHINPAVTIGIWVGNKIQTGAASIYIFAQLLGAVLAGWCLLAVFPEDIWKPVNLGTPTLAAETTFWGGIFLEALLTFFLVFVVYGTAVDPRGSGQIAGFAIGLVLTFDILVGGPLTGASMNPARTFGPALASGTWHGHLVYWIGPIIGAVIAAVLYTSCFLENDKSA